MERRLEVDSGQAELQREAPQQVQRLRLRRGLALRPRPRPVDQAEQVIHSRYSQESLL